MITGAAPISPTVLTFLRAALGCQVSTAQCSHSERPVGNHTMRLAFLIVRQTDIETRLLKLAPLIDPLPLSCQMLVLTKCVFLLNI